MATPSRTVLFDLDGTLSDSAPGILAALRHAFDVHGIPRLEPQVERALLGPPFAESLPSLIDPDAVPAVIDSYRERYAETMFDAAVFPGVTELLTALHGAGDRLAVATSKPTRFAEPIVEQLGLAPFFSTIGGDDLAGSRPTKALVIAAVLHEFGNPDPGTVTMVGDRSFDVLGAREHGIETIAVTWGYAPPGELARARPAAVCSTAAEVGAVLGVAVDA